MNKIIAIIGGGNGAHTMAADLALQGAKVRMYEESRFIGKLEKLAKTLTINASGVVSGEAKIEMLTDDMEKSNQGCRLCGCSDTFLCT